MDLRSIIAPVIQDRESLEEFSEALIDRAPEVERDVARLLKTAGDREIIADLFRAIHNIKGDAALCKFELGVAVAHPIETMMSRFREGEIPFSELLAETILLAIDRLELATDALLSGKSPEHLHLLELIEGLEELAASNADDVDSLCAGLIEAVTGFPSVIGDISSRAPRVATPKREQKNASADLQFFRSLALQLESRSPLFKGRTMRILRLALETNKVGGNKVDPVQLEAAVYMHDVGMMLLPEAVWLKIGKMTAEDKLALRNHPGFAGGLLQRIEGWEEAAEMVLQHHEMPDGAVHASSDVE